MTQTDKLVAAATAMIGKYPEEPSGSNCNALNTEYYGRKVSGASYSWCGVTVTKMFFDAGLEELTPFYNEGDKFRYNNGNSAYCPNWVSAAKSRGQWVTKDYRRGDVVLFDWDGDGRANHIGLITSVDSDKLCTIEGNVNNNVCVCTRPIDKKVLGAFRPANLIGHADFIGESEPSAPTVQLSDSVKASCDALDKLNKRGLLNEAARWKSILAAIDGAAPLTPDDSTYALNNLKYIFFKWWSSL